MEIVVDKSPQQHILCERDSNPMPTERVLELSYKFECRPNSAREFILCASVCLN